MSTKQAKPNLLETLKTLDLSEIDAELDGIHSQIGELQSQADKLRAVRKAVDVAINGKQPRAPRGSKKKPAKAASHWVAPQAPAPVSGGPELVERIRLYLQHAGTSGVGAIAATLKVPEQLVSGTLKANRQIFGWNPRGGGWELRRGED